MKGTWFFALVIVATGCLHAQDNWSKKELLDELKKPKISDTTRIDVYNELCWPVYSYDLPDSSIFFGNLAIALAKSSKDARRLCIAYRRIGITYGNIGQIKEAIDFQEKSFGIADSIGWQRAKYLSLNNVGAAYLNLGLLNKSLDYFLQSLLYLEGTGQYGDLSRVYSNCGVIYRRINNALKAREYFILSKKAADQSANPDLQVNADCNVSSTFRMLGQMDSAKFYLDEARRNLSRTELPASHFTYFLAEGLYYLMTDDNEKCLNALKEAQKHVTMTSDRSTLLINFAEYYQSLKDESRAYDYYESAYKLVRGLKMYDDLQLITLNMAKISEKRKDLANYSRFINLHLAYRDSNEKENKAQELIARQLEFDYERKHVADSIRFEHRDRLRGLELEVASARLGREKTARVFLIGIISLTVMFAFLLGSRLRLTRKQKKLIEEQKQLVDIKNREILDSISYARRLQDAILSDLAAVRQKINLDVLYLPKDLIGGDFYFYDEYMGHRFIAVCDCTGHGIPGALMSVVCHRALATAIREHKLTDPAAILDKTREIIVKSLNADTQNIRDGMDCALLVINSLNGSALFAGAYNPLWIMKGKSVHVISPDKQSVSYYEHPLRFTSKEATIHPGDIVYLFSDGYADQFGGPRGKKYKYKTLQTFLTSVSTLSPADQVSRLNENFSQWKGELDQVDDVTIAVIRF